MDNSYMKTIMDKAIEMKSSDIHLTEGKCAILRINGSLIKANESTMISKENVLWFIKEFDASLLPKFEKEKFLDMSYTYGNTRFRANFYVERKKCAVALRLIPSLIPDMSSLSLPDALKNILGLKDGLVLVTGATGSGKSTTIASIINEINKTRAEHILTIEDPIEFVYQDNMSLIHQREIGSDCITFRDGVMCALREDPDIIVLGEIRTHESISTALTLAETGHLVFATLHTRSAAESINRIIDVFSPEQQNQIRIQLAGALKYVIAQKLVKSSDRKGRLPLIEFMVVNQAISAAIVNKSPVSAIQDQIHQHHIDLKSQTFAQSAKGFADKGLVSLADVKDYLA